MKLGFEDLGLWASLCSGFKSYRFSDSHCELQ